MRVSTEQNHPQQQLIVIRNVGQGATVVDVCCYSLLTLRIRQKRFETKCLVGKERAVIIVDPGFKLD